jgi:hypothetical protein
MWKTVEVDIDLSDFDDVDLIERLEDRGYTITGGPFENSYSYSLNDDDPIMEIYQAMKLGKPYDELVRNFIMDRTGRIL